MRAVTASFAGHGRVEVVRRGPRSVVTRAAAASPLRLLTPRNHGQAAWIYAATYGGGLVGGDAVRLDVAVGAGATAMLSTQASTKIYRSPRGASSDIDATVGAGGLLALLPDPVVCFASSAYRQTQRVHLQEDAGLVLVDWLSSGRRAAGERWRFDRYSSRLEVHTNGRLALLDATALEADSGNLLERAGRFNVLCTVVLIGPALGVHAARAVSSISSLPVEKRSAILAGASPLRDDGCIVRIAGIAFEDVAALVRAYLDFVPAVLGDDPWARKW